MLKILNDINNKCKDVRISETQLRRGEVKQPPRGGAGFVSKWRQYIILHFLTMARKNCIVEFHLNT